MTFWASVRQIQHCGWNWVERNLMETCLIDFTFSLNAKPCYTVSWQTPNMNQFTKLNICLNNIPFENVMAKATNGAAFIERRCKGIIDHFKNTVSNVLWIYCIICYLHMVGNSWKYIFYWFYLLDLDEVEEPMVFADLPRQVKLIPFN